MTFATVEEIEDATLKELDGIEAELEEAIEDMKLQIEVRKALGTVTDSWLDRISSALVHAEKSRRAIAKRRGVKK